MAAPSKRARVEFAHGTVARSLSQKVKPHVVPPGGYYQAKEPQATHMARIRRMGIEESLLEPVSPAAKGATIRRGLYELQDTQWRPTRLGFHVRWPGRELPDRWYEMVATDLLVRVQRFADDYFGHGDLPQRPYWDSAWLTVLDEDDGGAVQKFMYYASQVARPDRKTGGWEALLDSKMLRPLLVSGILARVLDESVFGELLFGCDSNQRTMLDAQDECTLELDGYERTSLRCKSVRAIMSGEALTPCFWDRVDELALQLTTLLLPLVRLMDRYFQQSRDTSLRAVHQGLHHIVAEAGYLSLGIRQSNNIFSFSFPALGLPWDLDQEDCNEEVYKASKAAAAAQEAVLEREWQEQRVLGKLDNLNDGTQKKALYVVGASDDDEDSDDEHDEQPNWYVPRPRMANVQIAVWPMLQRYAAVNQRGVGGDNDDDGAGDGQKMVTLLKSQVVYYSGFVDPAADEREGGPPLDRYLAVKRRQRWTDPEAWHTWRGVSAVLTAMLSVAACVAVVGSDTVGWSRDGVLKAELFLMAKLAMSRLGQGLLGLLSGLWPQMFLRTSGDELNGNPSV